MEVSLKSQALCPLVSQSFRFDFRQWEPKLIGSIHFCNFNVFCLPIWLEYQLKLHINLCISYHVQ